MLKNHRELNHDQKASLASIARDNAKLYRAYLLKERPAGATPSGHDCRDVNVVLVPIGGGGLSSGVASAIKAVDPSTAVIGVGPALAADATESLRTGVLAAWPAAMTARTIADGLHPTGLSELTFAHLRERLDDVVTVTEEQIRSAVGVLARSAHLVAEPSGAVAVAAYVYRRNALPAGKTVAVISGRNTDPHLLGGIVLA